MSIKHYRLLQARTPNDPVREEERASFAARLRVPITQIETFDLLQGDTSLERVTHGVDAVLVGGSGEFSVYDRVAWMPSFFDTLGSLADAGFPTFASCFGFQGMVMCLGGQVELDDSCAEVGTFELFLTDEAAADPVFSQLPAQFLAQLGHKDRATRMPSGVINFARSRRCPYQAMKVGAGPVYATQFHPELTGPENRARFERYLTLYAKVFGMDRATHMLDGFVPSPATTDLLYYFARSYVMD